MGLLGQLHWTSSVTLKGFEISPSLEKVQEVSPSGASYEVKTQLGSGAQRCICLSLFSLCSSAHYQDAAGAVVGLELYDN